ncbi:MAG TPA: hypothetical protein VK003_20925, partial [Oceanobacillus sp.]|nr:hypothetical protein [Oceanobacillus sp.]
MANRAVPAPDLAPHPDTKPLVEDSTPRVVVASQWQLMWWKFRRHRLAMISLVIIFVFYVVAFFAGFFAPQATSTYNRRYTQAPPQVIHWFDNGVFAPYVYG